MYNCDAYFLSTYIYGYSYCYTFSSNWIFFFIFGWFFVCAKDSSIFVISVGYFFALQFIRNKIVKKLHVKTKSAELLTYTYFIS